MCIGTRPALVPNPASARTKTRPLVNGDSPAAALLNESNERLPVWKYRTRNAAVIRAVPMCVMTR